MCPISGIQLPPHYEADTLTMNITLTLIYGTFSSGFPTFALTD